jgi:hypothetical protein
MQRLGDARYSGGGYGYTGDMRDLEAEYLSAIGAQDGTIAAELKAATDAGLSMAQALARLYADVRLADTQRELLQVQAQRLNQGLPPLAPTQQRAPAWMGWALGALALGAVWHLSRGR